MCSSLNLELFLFKAGGKDLLKRSWKDLAEHIKIEVRNPSTSFDTSANYVCSHYLNLKNSEISVFICADIAYRTFTVIYS